MPHNTHLAHPITIERIDTGQLAALETLACATFTTTFGHLYTQDNLLSHLQKTCSAEYFAHEFARGNHIDIAHSNGTLWGYIKYGSVEIPVDHHDDDAEIHRLYVDATQQRSGIGKMLLNHVLESDRLRNAPRIFLGVWENNHKAQTFYRHYGFIPVSEYIYHVGTHQDREIIMQRTII